MAVNALSDAACLPQLLIHGFAHAFEQRRDIQEVVGGCRRISPASLVRSEFSVSRLPPQQAGQQHDPGAGKAERQVVEDAVLPRLVFHQQVKAVRGAAEHVVYIPGGQNHAFRLARRAGRVNDGDRVGRSQRGASSYRSAVR